MSEEEEDEFTLNALQQLFGSLKGLGDSAVEIPTAEEIWGTKKRVRECLFLLVVVLTNMRYCCVESIWKELKDENNKSRERNDIHKEDVEETDEGAEQDPRKVLSQPKAAKASERHRILLGSRGRTHAEDIEDKEKEEEEDADEQPLSSTDQLVQVNAQGEADNLAQIKVGKVRKLVGVKLRRNKDVSVQWQQDVDHLEDDQLDYTLLIRLSVRYCSKFGYLPPISSPPPPLPSIFLPFLS